MSTLYNFLKSTAIGGLLVLVPIGLLGYILFEAIHWVHQSIKPVFEWLPWRSPGGISLALLISIAVLIGICFLAGLLAQLTLVRGLVERLERLILSNIPGYSLMKNVGEQFVGVDSKDIRQTILVELSHGEQIGFLMDQLPDGRRVVFLPNAPNAFAGVVQIFPAERVQPMNLPLSKVLEILGRLGVRMHMEWPAPAPAIAQSAASSSTDK